MSNIRITQRGGDVPVGAGQTDDNGFPLVTGDGLVANAWALWQSAKNRATAESAPPKSNSGVLGVLYFCKMHEIEKLIWPVLVTAEGDPSFPFSKYCRDEIRQYLQDSGNMILDSGISMGRTGATWWIRTAWKGPLPKAPEAKFIPPATADVTRMLQRQQEADDDALDALHMPPEGALPPEPEVAAPELAGNGSLLADILLCLHGDDRMHAADLLILLSAGNPQAYAGLTITSLGKRLKELGVEFDRVTINYKTLAGVRRTDVQEALDRAADAEAAQILSEAHSKAEAVAAEPIISRAQTAVEALHLLDNALAAILMENEALLRHNEELNARVEQLDRLGGKPDPETISALVEAALVAKNKEIEELKFEIKGLRRMRGK